MKEGREKRNRCRRRRKRSRRMRRVGREEEIWGIGDKGGKIGEKRNNETN
jgi:hypothetical protein